MAIAEVTTVTKQDRGDRDIFYIQSTLGAGDFLATSSGSNLYNAQAYITTAQQQLKIKHKKIKSISIIQNHSGYLNAKSAHWDYIAPNWTKGTFFYNSYINPAEVTTEGLIQIDNLSRHLSVSPSGNSLYNINKLVQNLQFNFHMYLNPINTDRVLRLNPSSTAWIVCAIDISNIDFEVNAEITVLYE